MYKALVQMVWLKQNPGDAGGFTPNLASAMVCRRVCRTRRAVMINAHPAPNTRPHLSKWLLVATDLLMFLLAHQLGFWLAAAVRHWRALPVFVATPDASLRLSVWLGLVLAGIGWFWLVRGHYTQRRPFWDETRDVVMAMLVLAVLDAALMFMLKSPFSRLWWLTTWSVSLLAVVLGRVLMRRLMMLLGTPALSQDWRWIFHSCSMAWAWRSRAWLPGRFDTTIRSGERAAPELPVSGLRVLTK